MPLTEPSRKSSTSPMWMADNGQVHGQRAIKFALAAALGLMDAAAQLQPARIVVLIGPPGSGKTTQAVYLRKRYKIPAISLAQLLAHEISRDSALGKAAAGSLATGEFLGDGPANDLIMARLLRSDAGRGFVLDGYPATENQAQTLDAWLSEHNMPKPTIVVLNVPEDVSRTRLTRRRRAEDDPANIEQRLSDYREVGRIVEQWYGKERIVRVDGTGTPPEVAQRIADGIDAVQSRDGLLQRTPEDGGLKRRGTQDDPSEPKP